MGLFDSPWHILIVLVVLVVLFGSAKLPKAAKSMGEAMRIFKKEAQKLHEDDPQQAAQAQVTPQQAAPPKKIPPNEKKEPAPDEAAKQAAPTGPTIQLGAYASTVKAETAWKLLSGRFPAVAALNKVVVTANVGGKSVYRLRASGSSEQTRAACAATLPDLRVAEAGFDRLQSAPLRSTPGRTRTCATLHVREVPWPLGYGGKRQ